MTTANYPPQAYTREVLTQAFHWLRTQPQSVKDRAVSADSLVSLYLHARRQEHLGSWESEAPVSSENFKSDLKDLAQGLRQFENSFSPSASSSPLKRTSPRPLANPEPSANEALEPLETEQPTPGVAGFGSSSSKPPSFSATTATTQVEQETRVSTSTTRITSQSHSGMEFDEQTLATLRAVKERLNLGSEFEAARLLIVLGSERLNSALPPSHLDKP